MLKVLLFSLVLVCTALPQYSSMYYYYNNQSVSGSGSGGTPVANPPIDPSTLTPINWFDENELSATVWGDKQSALAWGDGGATSYYPFTQNGLTYYECDASFTARYAYNASFMSSSGDFTFVWVVKNRVEGNTGTSNEGFPFGMFNQTAATGGNFGIDRRNTLVARFRLVDSGGNSITCETSDAINTNEWQIWIVSATNQTNNSALNVYVGNSGTGENLTASTETWTATNYNGVNAGTRLNAWLPGGNSANWTGSAEIIWFRTALNKTDAIGVGKWLANKWGLTINFSE